MSNNLLQNIKELHPEVKVNLQLHCKYLTDTENPVSQSPCFCPCNVSPTMLLSASLSSSSSFHPLAPFCSLCPSTFYLSYSCSCPSPITSLPLLKLLRSLTITGSVQKMNHWVALCALRANTVRKYCLYNYKNLNYIGSLVWQITSPAMAAAIYCFSYER